MSIAFCVFCGLPASGKTTFLRNFTGRLDQEENVALKYGPHTIFLHIEYDKIIPEHWAAGDTQNVLFGDVENMKQDEFEKNKSWKSLRYQILEVIESLVNHIQLCGKDSLSKLSQPEGVTSDIWKAMLPCILSLDSSWKDAQGQLVIIIDDNMYFHSMRYEYFKLARKCGTGFCQLFFNISSEKALERNRRRAKEQQVSDAVILRMAEKLEPPDPGNVAWERSTLVIETERHLDLKHPRYQTVFDFLMSALSNPVQPLQCQDEEKLSQSRVQCSASLLHQGDLILRKCVAAYMANGKQSCSARDLQSISKRALRAKDALLARLRENPFSLGVCSDWTIDLSSSDPSSDYYKCIAEAFVQEVSRFPT